MTDFLEKTDALPQRRFMVLDGGASENMPPIALGALQQDDLSALAPNDLGNLREMAMEARREISAGDNAVIARVEAEFTARIKAAGGRALPAEGFEIELADEFTSYAFNDERLRDAMRTLPPQDAEKVGKIIPEHTERVLEKFLRGNTASIQALIRKYGAESEIGKALSASMSRSKVGERLTIHRIVPDSRTIDQPADGSAI